MAAGWPNPPCILIVDDDEGFRAAVAALLTSAGFATEEAACADTALGAARRVRPDLALVDIRLPGRSGYEVLRELRAIADRPLPVILISGERTEPFDRAAGLGLGADDYIVKPFDEEELLARVRRLVQAREADARNTNLTARERDVLELLASGLGQAQIAEALVVSPKTVGTHIEHILQKLGAHSRAEAVAIAYRDGLIDRSA